MNRKKRRWSVGTRYDYSQMPYSSSRHEHGLSAYLTFMQSEYLFWRLAYQYTDRNFRVHGDKQEHETFLQCNFGLGPIVPTSTNQENPRCQLS